MPFWLCTQKSVMYSIKWHNPTPIPKCILPIVNEKNNIFLLDHFAVVLIESLILEPNVATPCRVVLYCGNSEAEHLQLNADCHEYFYIYLPDTVTSCCATNICHLSLRQWRCVYSVPSNQSKYSWLKGVTSWWNITRYVMHFYSITTTDNFVLNGKQSVQDYNEICMISYWGVSYTICCTICILLLIMDDCFILYCFLVLYTCTVYQNYHCHRHP